MAELNAVDSKASGCCSPRAQETCCEASAKDECCAAGHPNGCGCREAQVENAELLKSTIERGGSR
jgi:hypothetical protein